MAGEMSRASRPNWITLRSWALTLFGSLRVRTLRLAGFHGQLLTVCSIQEPASGYGL